MQPPGALSSAKAKGKQAVEPSRASGWEREIAVMVGSVVGQPGQVTAGQPPVRRIERPGGGISGLPRCSDTLPLVSGLCCKLARRCRHCSPRCEPSVGASQLAAGASRPSGPGLTQVTPPRQYRSQPRPAQQILVLLLYDGMD